MKLRLVASVFVAMVAGVLFTGRASAQGGGTNIVLGLPADRIEVYSVNPGGAPYTTTNAVDGDTGTAYISAAWDPEQWIRFNFTTSDYINSVAFVSYPDNAYSITLSHLEFLSGPNVDFGAVPGDGNTHQVTFTVRSADWVRFVVDSIPQSPYLVVPEMRVFDAGQFYFTCTLSYGHTFDFGLVFGNSSLEWSVPFTTSNTLRGIVADASVIRPCLGSVSITSNNNLPFYSYSQSSADVAGSVCAESSSGACAALGTFSSTVSLSNLGGPGSLTLRFYGTAQTEDTYIRARLSNLRAIYYGFPGADCSTSPPITPTATPTPTPRATPALPITPTPRATPNPPVLAASFGLKDVQGAIDTIGLSSNTVTSITTYVETKTTANPLVIQGWSPFTYIRGAFIVLDQFEWLTILARWFVMAPLIIVAVTALRLVISLWGVVQRIIQLLDLIPFT